MDQEISAQSPANAAILQALERDRSANNPNHDSILHKGLRGFLWACLAGGLVLFIGAIWRASVDTLKISGH